jgi:peptidoglycan/xylan/chitin deacetylase (PgdA/CDA1 family)
MVRFSQEFNILPLREIEDRIDGGRSLPNKCLSITFDDGFRDNYLYAYPILKRHRIPATVFLTTQPIDDGDGLWFDRVFDAFNSTTRESIRIHVTGEELRWDGTPTDRRRAAERALSCLMDMEEERRKETAENLLSLLGGTSVGSVEGAMLTWPEIREMADGGMEFGSHTVTHPILTRLSPERLRSEIVHSQHRIECETGRRPRMFAYPIGKEQHFSPKVAEALRETGYTMAFTTLPRVNRTGDNLFSLGRIPVWGDHYPTTAIRLGMLRLRRSWRDRV